MNFINVVPAKNGDAYKKHGSERTRTRRIVFHIGLERTGTTSLQNYCFKHRKRLLQNSILYPVRNLGFKGWSHRALVASYLPHDPYDYFVRGGRADRHNVVDSVIREIEDSSAQTIVLSAEHFSSRFRRPQIMEVAEDFAKFDCKIVIFLRDHLSRFYSSYANRVASGGGMTIEDYAHAIALPGCLEFRYADTIGPWEEVFGKPNIDVRVCHRGQDVVNAFFDARGMTPLSADALAPVKTERSDLVARTHRSLGPRRTETLRAANVRNARLVGSSSEIARTAQQYACVILRNYLYLSDWLALVMGMSRDQPWALDPARLDGLIAIARADEDWLKDRYGVSLRPSADQEIARPDQTLLD